MHCKIRLPFILMCTGIFVPMHRISKALSQPPEKKRRKKSEKLRTRDSLYTTNKAIEAQAQLQMNSELQVKV